MNWNEMASLIGDSDSVIIIGFNARARGRRDSYSETFVPLPLFGPNANNQCPSPPLGMLREQFRRQTLITRPYVTNSVP